MGYERRPPNIYPDQGTSFSASSSTTYSRRVQQQAPRTPSPPASAYFSKFVGDEQEPQPTPDAQAHFAYSTTLRRHHLDGPLNLGTPHSSTFPGLESLRSAVTDEGPSGLWDRLVKSVTGRAGQSSENGYTSVPTGEQRQQETPSARYVNHTVEVREFTRHCLARSLTLRRAHLHRFKRPQQMDSTPTLYHPSARFMDTMNSRSPLRSRHF